PVGYAWQIVMHERPDINLYHKDNHHQSYAGSYLAAAVAYLTVYGEKFGSNPADCKLKAETAAYLRSVAERVVLNGEKWNKK
ncbi:MAG: SGNH/GDSL hydrolase family protein, partial [Alistipes sp.]|nr:SGNH/GDSL hydrolase family protein [Alistipes sp.]